MNIIPKALPAKYSDEIKFHWIGNTFLDKIHDNLPGYSPIKGIMNTKLWSIPALRSIIRKIDPICMIVELPWLNLSAKFSGLFRIPVINTLHNVNYVLYGDSIIQKKLLRLYELSMLNLCDIIMTVNELDKKILQANNVHKPILTTPNGVDMNRYKGQEKSQEILEISQYMDKPRPWIVFHGNLIDPPNQKALKFIYSKLVSELDKENFDYTIFIIGYGNPYNIHPQNLVYLGWVDELESILLQMDIGIVPVIEESGLEMKVLEYLAAGIPTIVTSSVLVGIDNLTKNHVFVSKLDEVNFKNAIIEINQNNSFKNKLIENGLKLIKSKYSWNQVLQPYKIIIDQIISKYLDKK